MVKRAPDGVRLDNALQHGKQVRTEALHSQRDAIDAEPPQRARKLLRHRLRVGLHGDLARRWKRTKEPLERGAFRKGRRASAEEDGLQLRRQLASLQLELAEQRIDVRSMLRRAPDHGDEVAVAATVRAERQVDVEVTRHFFSPLRLSTARNASCGTSTMPTCFMRFLPAFCCSSNFRLREMSPP